MSAPSTFSLRLTKWSLDFISKFIKADVRLHNVEAVQDSMAIIFAVNHFTRLETLLLPYIIHKHTGKEVWGLAAAELFQGRIGEFLRAVGTVSTKDPDRDKIIINALLTGEHPWMIFPEGAMIKDKKVVDPAGNFMVYTPEGRRPPHKGVAVLALLSEYYRHKIECLAARSDMEALTAALERFGLSSFESVLKKHTYIIPVNITYYPIRSRENLLVRLASRFKEDLSPRALEELSVEGTVLSEDTDIDISLGDPIDVREYLNAPEYAELMACGLRDLDALEHDPRSLFHDAAEKLMLRYMRAIYDLTTINYDHIFATIIRYQDAKTFTERAYRNRIFLCAQRLPSLGYKRVHTLLERTYRDIVFEEPSEKFQDFLELCLQEGILQRLGDTYAKNFTLQRGTAPFHEIRRTELTEVIANEIEPLQPLVEMIKEVARLPRFVLSQRIRDFFLEEDKRLFEEDYAAFYEPGVSKSADVGRPFFLKPSRVKAGVVLAHGYMAAPLEVRALGEYLYHHGYAVYGVRLRGHGTSPQDLARTRWEEWYESFNRGYAIIKSLTDYIVLGGFSTGGCLALIAAARKAHKPLAAFSICAPLHLRNYNVRLAPSIVTLNALLRRFGRAQESWEYVDNDPENPHINYQKNPLSGVKQLVTVMSTMENLLPSVQIPTLVIQGSKDPTVNPVSAHMIFEALGAKKKELTIFERQRHGIINGEDAEEIFARVHQFLERVRLQELSHTLSTNEIAAG
jgi:esterase/lipase/1-acyl-sn-glycerol-3-phosphate acyltransferase